jgi:hypothetical protein
MFNVLFSFSAPLILAAIVGGVLVVREIYLHGRDRDNNKD